MIGSRVYAHARAWVTVILPPVGNTRSAILVLECLERYLSTPIFRDPATRSRCTHPAGSMRPMQQYSLSRSILDPMFSGATASAT